MLPYQARLQSCYCTKTKLNCVLKTEFRMPKKFKGVNTKAEEARSRKEAAKVAEKERKQKEEEDKYWEDNDKHVMRKQQRKVSFLSGVLLKYSLV